MPNFNYKSPIKPGQLLTANITKLADYYAVLNSMPPGAKKQKAAEIVDQIKDKKEKLAIIKKNLQPSEKPLSPKLLEIFSYIEKNCSESVAATKKSKKLLYRGFGLGNGNKKIFVGYPRAKRKPKDSSPTSQVNFDKLLSLNGFTALRSNSLFCTTNESFATSFGNTFVVFPKDGFDFTWSPKFRDVIINEHDFFNLINLHSSLKTSHYGRMNRAASLFREARKQVIDLTGGTAGEPGKIAKFLGPLRTVVTSLKESPINGFKTLYDVVSKYAAMTNIPNKLKVIFTEWLKDFRDDYEKIANYLNNVTTEFLAKQLVSEYKFTNTNLPAAYKSENEIYILGEYVALNSYYYRSAIEKYFLRK